MKKLLLGCVCAMAIASFSCNSTRTIVPLQKGEHKVDFTFGGPGIVQFGAPMPLPLSSINYNYGISDKYTLRGSLHATALLFGVFQSDLGYTSYIFKQTEKDWGITYSPTLNLMANRWEGDFRMYPQIDLNIYKRFNQKHLLYGSISSWFALMQEKGHAEPQNQHILPALAFGYTKMNEKWQWGFEAKYIAPFTSNQDIVLNYISPSNHGAMGFYFTLSRKLNYSNNE